MRKYEKSHPWLSFNIDLNRAPASLWISLGEARSKCEHIAGVPLPPATAQELHRVYLAKGVHATTAIEGNTLSEAEVKKRLEGHLELPLSKEYLGQEVDNVIDACNALLSDVNRDDFALLKVDRIKDFNKKILYNLKLDPGVVPGEISLHNVVVANYLASPREDCDFLLERLCAWLNDASFLQAKDPIIYGVIRAILAHLYWVMIHPFGDGNGRTSRLIEYQILLAAGVPTPAAHLLSNHYNDTRSEYYRQLAYISGSKGDFIPFIQYAVQGFIDGLRNQLLFVRDTQWSITWHKYIHDQFENKQSPADIRRRHLVLDLSVKSNPVPLHQIAEVSPRVAVAYAGKGARTITRDLQELIRMGLVERKPSGYMAKPEIILSFLPMRRMPKSSLSSE